MSEFKKGDFNLAEAVCLWPGPSLELLGIIYGNKEPVSITTLTKKYNNSSPQKLSQLVIGSFLGLMRRKGFIKLRKGLFSLTKKGRHLSDILSGF